MQNATRPKTGSGKNGLWLVIILIAVIIGAGWWLLIKRPVSLVDIKTKSEKNTNYSAEVTVSGSKTTAERVGQKVKATTSASKDILIYQDFAAGKSDLLNTKTNKYYEKDKPTNQVVYNDIYSDYDLNTNSTGNETVNRVLTRKFELVDKAGKPVIIWAAVQTGLPIKVQKDGVIIELSYSKVGQINEESITLPAGAAKADSVAEFSKGIE